MQNETGLGNAPGSPLAAGDVGQFDGWHFRDAQVAMEGWSDEQLSKAAAAAHQLRDENEREADKIKNIAKNWHQIGWAANQLLGKREAVKREAANQNTDERS